MALLETAIGWIAEHPGRTAAEIAEGIGHGYVRELHELLLRAAAEGLVLAWKPVAPRGDWRPVIWTASGPHPPARPDQPTEGNTQ